MAKNQRENKEYETTPQAVDPTFTPLASTTGSARPTETTVHYLWMIVHAVNVVTQRIQKNAFARKTTSYWHHSTAPCTRAVNALVEPSLLSYDCDILGSGPSP